VRKHGLRLVGWTAFLEKCSRAPCKQAPNGNVLGAEYATLAISFEATAKTLSQTYSVVDGTWPCSAATGLTCTRARQQHPAMLRAQKHWLPVVLWMGFIFAMSTSLGTAENTSRFIEPLLRWLMPHSPPETIAFAHFLIRKCGHFSEYAVLALLLWRAAGITLKPSSPTGILRVAGVALLVATAYAATDEFHQCFVPGRTPSLGDVLIDASGALAALAVVTLWRGRRRQAGCKEDPACHAPG